MHRFTLRSVTLVACETVLILGAVAIAAYIRLGDWAWQILIAEHGPVKTLFIAGVTQICLYYGDLYDLRRMADRRELFIRLSQALAAASFVLALSYYWFPSLVIGRGVFAIAAVLAITFIVGWRVAFEWLSGHVGPRERLLLVGTNAAAVALAQELFERRRELGVEIVGFIDPNPSRVGEPVINPGVIGAIDDIPSIVRARSVDRVVVSLADARGMLPMDKLLEMKVDGRVIRPPRLRLRGVHGEDRHREPAPELVHLLAGLPQEPCAVGVQASGGHALRCRLPGPLAARHGGDCAGGEIHVARPRALPSAAGRPARANLHGPQVPHDARRRRGGDRAGVGREARRQPRDRHRQHAAPHPARRAAAALERPQGGHELRRAAPGAAGVRERAHPRDPVLRPAPRVRPGITGWAQVRYTYGASVEDALQKLQYDLYYIKNLSVSLDLLIVLETIKTVILRRGA